jgi:signal transduction histidine kinase
MIDALVVELARQGEDVRRLSRSLLPLAIDDGDLGGALAGLAQRFSDDGLAIRVTVAEDVDLPAPAQVAVYHLASEALLNVRRHAQAQHCEVVVRRRQDGGILVVVSDDGVGLAPDATDGVGLRSMRERAAELGGSLEVSAAGRGSRVTLRLPPASET